jgi:hypothetical protein
MMKMWLQKVISKRTKKKFFLVVILKVTDENTRIRIQNRSRIRICTKMSRIRNTESHLFCPLSEAGVLVVRMIDYRPPGGEQQVRHRRHCSCNTNTSLTITHFVLKRIVSRDGFGL